MIETHRPTTSPTLLIQKLQDEIQRQQQQDTSPAAALSSRLAYRQSQFEHINIMLNGAAAMAQPRTALPHKLRHVPILGLGKVQRLLMRVYNFLFKEHRTVNLTMIQAIRESAALNQQLSEQTVVLEGFIQELNAMVGDRLGGVERRLTGIEAHLTQLQANVSTTATQFNAIEQRFHSADVTVRDELESSRSWLRQQFGTLENRLTVAERTIQFLEKNHGDRLRYLQADMAQQKRLITLFLEDQQHLNTAIDRPQAIDRPLSSERIQSVQERQLDVFYRAFEDHFRGDRSQIRERLRVYLPVLQATDLRQAGDTILDIGCGRGEWLELLRDEGYQNVGLDINQAMLEQCRELALTVFEGDALNHLKSLPDSSLGGITGFHIVEHLPFEILVQLMAEAYRVVRSGGIIIFETPNPRNVTVGSCNFYFDPTHKNPIPSEILQFMAHYSGFEPVQILPLNPSDNPRVLEDSDLAHRFNELFYGSMDYAVIGVKA